MPPESRTNGYYGNISRASINKCLLASQVIENGLLELKIYLTIYGELLETCIFQYERSVTFY